MLALMQVKSEHSQTISQAYWAKGFSASGIDKRFFGVFKRMDQLITESEAERLIGFTFRPPCIQTTCTKRAREDDTAKQVSVTLETAMSSQSGAPAKAKLNEIKQALHSYVGIAVQQLSQQLQENMQQQIQQLQQQMQEQMKQQVQKQVQEELDRFFRQLAKNDSRDVAAAVCIMDLHR
jgi:exonuclease VII large subunit